MTEGLNFIEKIFEARRRAGAKRKGKFEIYPRADGDFGFRFRSRNNQVTFTSGGEGYTRRRDARRAVRELQKVIGAQIVDVEAPATSETQIGLGV